MDKHYVIVHEWASEENCAYGVQIIGVEHDIDTAKDVFNQHVVKEREYADNNGDTVYEDSETCFDAGQDGSYNVEHSKLYIQEVDQYGLIKANLFTADIFGDRYR